MLVTVRNKRQVLVLLSIARFKSAGLPSASFSVPFQNHIPFRSLVPRVFLLRSRRVYLNHKRLLEAALLFTAGFLTNSEEQVP